MLSVFFFNDTATTEIYTLSLHDALPISPLGEEMEEAWEGCLSVPGIRGIPPKRSEEHTSEIQSLTNIVCRLLLEKKKYIQQTTELVIPQNVTAHESTFKLKRWINMTKLG